MVLIVEKINSRFVEATKSKQSTGLSVCLEMIKKLDQKIVLLKKFTAEEVYLAIKAHKPKAVIFEAMSFSYLTLIETKRMFPDVDIFVHMHSKFPFLGQEHSPVYFVEQCVENGIGVIFNHRDMLNTLPLPGCIYLPNVYSPVYSPDNSIKLSHGNNNLHVGCHGSLRHMKNHIVQAAAACRYAKRIGKQLYFHVNTTRNDGELAAIQSNLTRVLKLNGGNIVHTPWLDHNKFLEYIAKLDIGMQVSLCETFNLVAADYVHAGIPIVVSPEIEWASDQSKFYGTDVSEIVSGMHLAMMRKDLIQANKNCLVEHNTKAVYDWKVFLSKYIEGVSSGF